MFSHLPGSGAEVNFKDLLFSGTKFSSLTCVKVAITLLVMAEWSADPLTTVKDIAFSWLCEAAEHHGAAEQSSFKLILNQQQFIKCHTQLYQSCSAAVKTNVRVGYKWFTERKRVP